MSQKESKDLDGDDYLVINMNDLKKLRVQELREKLSEFGLNIKGTKTELLSRLEDHLSAAAESEEELALIDVANNSQPSDSTENLELEIPVKQKVCSFPNKINSTIDTQIAPIDRNNPRYSFEEPV